MGVGSTFAVTVPVIEIAHIPTPRSSSCTTATIGEQRENGGTYLPPPSSGSSSSTDEAAILRRRRARQCQCSLARKEDQPSPRPSFPPIPSVPSANAAGDGDQPSPRPSFSRRPSIPTINEAGGGSADGDGGSGDQLPSGHPQNACDGPAAAATESTGIELQSIPSIPYTPNEPVDGGGGGSGDGVGSDQPPSGHPPTARDRPAADATEATGFPVQRRGVAAPAPATTPLGQALPRAMPDEGEGRAPVGLPVADLKDGPSPSRSSVFAWDDGQERQDTASGLLPGRNRGMPGVREVDGAGGWAGELLRGQPQSGAEGCSVEKGGTVRDESSPGVVRPPAVSPKPPPGARDAPTAEPSTVRHGGEIALDVGWGDVCAARGKPGMQVRLRPGLVRGRSREADGGGGSEEPLRLKILLAEDSLPNQKLMCRILQRAGHNVEAVSVFGIAAVAEAFCLRQDVLRRRLGDRIFRS